MNKSRSFFTVILILSASFLLGANTMKRAVAQTPDNHYGETKVGGFTFKASEDTGSGMDLLEVFNSKGEKICSYISNKFRGERFWAVDAEKSPLKFSKEPDRFFVTEWKLPSSAATDMIKILDTSKPGPACNFIGSEKSLDHSFLGLGVDYSVNDDDTTLSIGEISARNDDSTILLVRKTSCKINSSDDLACQTAPGLSPYP